jgi:hypothetical protein
VAPLNVKTISIYKGVVAFICLQLIALAIVGYYPQMVNYLPNRMSFLSATSPPPRNPKLQICLEEYVTSTIDKNKQEVSHAINNAKAIDLSFLPIKIQNNLTSAFDSAEDAIASLNDIKLTSEIVRSNSYDYKPKLRKVRKIESEIKWYEKETKLLKNSLNYLKSDADKIARLQIKDQIIKYEIEIEHLSSKIPNSWAGTYKSFKKLTKEETNARRMYRKSADKSFATVFEFISVLDANSNFFEKNDEIKALKEQILIAKLFPKEAELFAKNLKTKFSKITGATKISSALRKVQKQLKPSKINIEKALMAYEKVQKLYDEQTLWRLNAHKTIRPSLLTYLDSISETLGSRQMPKLSRSQALYLAKCNSGHRDLSLSF